MGFNLEKVVPWGRSFEEYCAMFSLRTKDLERSILGVGDGPAAFNAVLTALDGEIISVDPVYAFSARQIRQRINMIYVDMIKQVSANAENLRLDKFGSAEALGQLRMQAMLRFLSDFEKGKQQGRYINEELPKLSFSEQKFDLALCSHLLFLYSEQLGLEFHIQSILELTRVAKEVRVFPLLDLSHKLSSHLQPVIEKLTEKGLKVSVETVDYEFQIGANQMLRIKKAV